jgi:hypothetical protein
MTEQQERQWKLTAERAREILDYVQAHHNNKTDGDVDDRINEAIITAAVKQVVEWMWEPCYEHWDPHEVVCHIDCDECMAALKQEVGG